MCTICQHIQFFHHEDQYVICLGNEMQATRCLQLLQPVPSCSSRLVREFYILIRQHIYCTKIFQKMLSSVLKGSIWTINHKQFILRDSMKIPEQAVAVLSEELTVSLCAVIIWVVLTIHPLQWKEIRRQRSHVVS